MPRPKRDLHAVAASTVSPPAELPVNHSIARVKSAAGNNLYHVEFADSSVGLFELPSRFRSAIWIKRGSYVVVDVAGLAARENKLQGEIVNVVREEKVWRKMSYWPVEFEKKREVAGDGSDDEDEDEGPKMPPSDDSEEEERG